MTKNSAADVSVCIHTYLAYLDKRADVSPLSGYGESLKETHSQKRVILAGNESGLRTKRGGHRPRTCLGGSEWLLEGDRVARTACCQPARQK